MSIGGREVYLDRLCTRQNFQHSIGTGSGGLHFEAGSLQILAIGFKFGQQIGETSVF